MDLSEQEKRQYSRHLQLAEVGSEGQKKLKNSSVLVVGAGGLGCPVLQYLTAAGIGRIGILDFDSVEESNLQRQILFGYSSLGKNKAEAARQRLKDLNPNCNLIAYPEKLDKSNALDYFSDYDIIVDGTDNFATRYLINDACVLSGKPYVFGAIHKYEGQVSVFNHEGGPTYRCLFPEPPSNAIPNCSQAGVLGVLPGIVGAQQANEVLKMILGLGQVLSGKVLLYNALTANSSMISISLNQAMLDEVLAQRKNFGIQKSNCTCACQGPKIASISAEKLHQLLTEKSHTSLHLVDVRELHETPELNADGVSRIPAGEIMQHLDQIPTQGMVVLFCQSGIRSEKIATRLQQEFLYTNLLNLKGGIIALEKAFPTLTSSNNTILV